MGMRARTGLRKVPPNATGRAEIERREGALRRLMGIRNFAKSPLPSRQWPPPPISTNASFSARIGPTINFGGAEIARTGPQWNRERERKRANWYTQL